MKVGIVGCGDGGLSAALKSLGHEVFLMTEDDARAAHELELVLKGLPSVKECSQYADDLYGRARDPKRKADRKKRMGELQRRAFEGGRP
jgi:hypothetical protein